MGQDLERQLKFSPDRPLAKFTHSITSLSFTIFTAKPQVFNMQIEQPFV